MRRAVIGLAWVVAIGATDVSLVSAWGYDAHRFITDRAIDLLPPEIKPFYVAHRGMIAEHAIDPDLWRTAGFEEEPPRHYINLDAYGAFPFAALPRDYDRAVAAFGRARLEAQGILPWRVGDVYGQLARQFQSVRTRATPLALEHVKFFSAVLSHYVGDAHVPLHANINYDGQLTNQKGVHARFETELFARFRDRLRLSPGAPPPISAPVNFAFETLVSGFEDAEDVLAADRAALGRGHAYDDVYFARFFTSMKPLLERRLSQAITGVAAAIAGAWQAGGRPALALAPVRSQDRKPAGPGRGAS